MLNLVPQGGGRASQEFNLRPGGLQCGMAPATRRVAWGTARGKSEWLLGHGLMLYQATKRALSIHNRWLASSLE